MRSTKNVVASMTEAGGQELPVRWVVLFTGTTATADYEPTGSAGESPGLVREVSNLCVQFHPHSEIRLFPRDREVYLYWRARSTGDHIVTRVSTAPNPDGVRISLEYVSLVFNADTFEKIGNNPFLVRSLKLPDLIREEFLSQKRDPLTVIVPLTEETTSGTIAPSAPENNALSTPENIQALEEFVASGTTNPPPTFATWWVSRGHVPENTFQIVLRAATPQAMTLREATDLASEMASGIKSAIPNVSGGDAVVTGLISSLLANSDSIIAEISAAADRVNSEGPDQFREHLTDASRKATQMSSDLAALEKRLSDPAAATRLAELAAQYTGFVPEVLKIRHPNPFGGRKNPTPSQFAGSSSTTDSRSNGHSDNRSSSSSRNTPPPPKNNGTLVGVGAVVAALVVGLGVWKLAPKDKKAADTKPTPVVNVAKKPTPAVEAKPSPPLSPDALAQQYADDILPIASLKAKTAATVSVTDNKKEPDESDMRSITMKAIKDAYHDTLPPADFDKVFGDSEDWTYARYRKTLTTLLPAVRKAANSASLVAFGEIKKTQAAVARNTDVEPRETPTPEPTRTPRSRDRDRDRNRETPTPQPTRRIKPTPGPVTVRPTPKSNNTGSAADSGL
jgi:hypothetical protein